MSLFLRPCVIGGETAPDDYSVVEENEIIGRIRRASERKPEVWVWAVNVNIPGVPNGTAEDLDRAKAAFRAAWSSFKASVDAEQIARAFAEAAVANRPDRYKR